MTVYRKKDRAMGAFIGLAVGDALGTTVEFRPVTAFRPSPTWSAAGCSS